MKAYAITIGWDGGRYQGRDFFVFALDVTEAVVLGMEVVSRLQERFNKFPKVSCIIRIIRIEEVAEVIGNSGQPTGDSTLEAWVDKQIQASKKDGDFDI